MEKDDKKVGSKKIFVGVKISPDTQDKILTWEKSFNILSTHWIKKDDLHITLVPPWTETDINGVKEKLNGVAKKFKPFEISLAGINYAPKQGNFSMIWAEIAENDEIANLKEYLEEVFGVKNEHRPWRPHITLARFKVYDFSKFPIKNLSEKILWKETIRELTLFESPRFIATGYRIICDIPLGQANIT